MTEFYTEARPQGGIYLYRSRDFATGMFNDPDDAYVQQQAAEFVLYQGGHDPMPPRYLAWKVGFCSEAAALFAVRAGLTYWTGSRGERRDQYLAFYDNEYTFDPSEEGYVEPTDPTEDEEHSPWCECQDCVPCECNEPECENCWPDGYDCGCAEAHCQYCNPDGPPDWCDCNDCVPPSIDDQDEYDPWQGLPAMPEPPIGRCRIGVEVEYNHDNGHYSRSDITTAIQRAGISCLSTGYGHEVTRFWKMTDDCTVTGGEVVSPIMSGGDDSIEQIREVIRIVKAGGGVTGRNVGLHVHLDVTRFHTDQLKALCDNMRIGQEFLAAFVPEHRYDGSNNHGATLLDSFEWQEIYEWLDTVDPTDYRRSVDNRNESCPVGRYVAFNFNAIMTYGTVECRLLGHTLNTIKVRTWIRVLQTIIEGSRMESVMTGDILAWLKSHGLESEHADHFRSVVTSRGNQRHLVAV